MIHNCDSIQFLSVKWNKLVKIHFALQWKFKLKLLETDDYHLCCLGQGQTHCTAQIPWFVSCTSFLRNENIITSFYVISTIIVIFNIISFIMKSDSQANSLIMRSIHLTDITYGIYLFILWINDLKFRHFIVYDSSWSSSIMCYISFTIALNFSLISPLLLSFMALQRYLIVAYPYNHHFKTPILL